MTSGDIASYDMRSAGDPALVDVPLFNILSVLEGQPLGETAEVVNTISGEVILALPQSSELPPFRQKDTILICGNQPDMLRRAVAFGVACVILCQAELPDDLREAPGSTCIISTPYDSYRTVRRIFQAIPVGRLARKETITAFHLDDYIDDVQEVVQKSRYRSYPILDAQERVVGHPLPVPPHQAPAQAGGAGGPQRGGPVGSRAGGDGHPCHHRPSPAGGHPDQESHLLPQRAGGQHLHHRGGDVPGAGADRPPPSWRA